ncbi:DUF3558 domain-containing protein [Nocardia sp. CA-128927]|uniref:DUF3558 domain-containing protein n=1 Tax=Nocardia sp. CA-128927 TaxID=3239975 RepID=UPI003D96FD65
MWAIAGVFLTTAVVAAGPVLAGCGSSVNGGGTPAASTTSTSGSGLAKDVPKGFDPCTGIPESVLASENLRATDRADVDAPGGVMWRGCAWVRRNGYSVSIRTTNLSVGAVRDRHFTDAQEFTIDGRRAISTRQFEGPHVMEACTVDVEMKGGSLEFNLNNPPSNKDTGSLDSCQLARSLAEKVMPSVPAGA